MQHWIQLIFIVLVALGPVFRWLIQKIANQAAARRLAQEQEREELERLRTGRVSNTSTFPKPPDPDPTLRRQAEIAELRRRAAAARRQAARPPDATTSTPAASPLEVLLGLPPGTLTGGTVAPSPRRQPSTPIPFPAKPPPASATQRDRQRRKNEADRLAAETKSRQARQLQIREFQAAEDRAGRTLGQPAKTQPLESRLLRGSQPISRTTPLATPTTPTTPTPPTTPGINPAGARVPKTASDWRRAFIMNEVMSRPVSMR